MSSSSSTPVDPNYRDGSREGRLKFSKRAEQVCRWRDRRDRKASLPYGLRESSSHPPSLPPSLPPSPQHLRDELALHARKECKDALGAFAACAKENGMFVVFKCRGLNNASKCEGGREGGRDVCLASSLCACETDNQKRMVEGVKNSVW